MNVQHRASHLSPRRWLLLALAGSFLFLQGMPSGRHLSTLFQQGFGPQLARAGADDLTVTVNSLRVLMKYNYVELDAALSGHVRRRDGSQGTYKVPLTLVYPTHSQRCNLTGIVDVVNSVFYETFSVAGTDIDPYFPSLFPFARMLVGEEFMFGRHHGGYVYAQVQWNKLVIERQREAGMLDDGTLHIDAGTDGYQMTVARSPH